jgi:hypothetical protein
MGSKNVRFWVRKNPSQILYVCFLDFKSLLIKKTYKKLNII